MKKIIFKNPQGGALYLAKVGFDWGAFWAIFLYGLPFFLRKMNILGAFCLGLIFLIVLGMGFTDMSPEHNLFQKQVGNTINLLVMLAFSLYFGIRGGFLTARYYVEQGYECVTKDETLLTIAKAKWGLEL